MTQKVSVNLGQIVNKKNNLKSDKKFIRTSKVDLVTPSSARNKKIDLTRRQPPQTAKNTNKKFNLELDQKKKVLEEAEHELARREKQKLDQKKEELKRELQISHI
jgi:hypothetical protein